MSKAVQFKMPVPKIEEADAWVGKGVEPHLKKAEVEGVAVTSAMKRLTIDVPLDLHQRIKIACVQRGHLMADEIRRLLEIEFPARS